MRRQYSMWASTVAVIACGSALMLLHPVGADAPKKRCLTKPNVSKKVDMVIHQCQEEIKSSLIEDALKIFTAEHGQWHDRRKRDEGGLDFSHPTIVSHEDKWIAGCLMQCVYRKNNAIDKNGWPTLDGLVSLYTDGVNEQGYFMATLRGVDRCLKGTSKKYQIKRNDAAENFEQCEVAFDVFDCISDMITDYCSGQMEDDH
ncbi:AGAP006368-PA [Anopheles gambiae str. PEST]|uniref:General odorant-binding protein 70 n=2 Tax=gambiae species complex TaxID=44542 RepID=OBP70_ANOGA|nr:general odorant-binding protein 70 isoform X1 [Anopheles coluzzii]XP_316397.2 general odorant-binding protein 70 isoform X1 [Anopheles gambiae]Q7Q5L4.2 RecName: Full=General odorant-binding protein 70; Flags: Precursor [Anopheles gambiae]EAA11535.2 AGAP006368-PA [Anopheles gambiae str. PEST]